MDGCYIHAFAFGRSTESDFQVPLPCFIQMIVKIMNILGNAWPFFQNMNLKVKEAGRPLLPTYLKGPRTFDLLLNIGFYDGVCLIACQPRPITYFEPKFSTLARKLHQTEINTYIICYILHLLSFLLKYYFFKIPFQILFDHRSPETLLCQLALLVSHQHCAQYQLYGCTSDNNFCAIYILCSFSATMQFVLQHY